MILCTKILSSLVLWTPHSPTIRTLAVACKAISSNLEVWSLIENPLSSARSPSQPLSLNFFPSLAPAHRWRNGSASLMAFFSQSTASPPSSATTNRLLALSIRSRIVSTQRSSTSKFISYGFDKSPSFPLWRCLGTNRPDACWQCH